MQYFFDTSAVVKIYHQETGSDRILPLYRINTHGRTNHLFSLDALQIATLSMIAEKDITFVCADKRLITLVKKMGTSVLEL